MIQHVRHLALTRGLALAAALAVRPVLGQASGQTSPQSISGPAATTSVTLLPQTAIPAGARIELNLRGGNYEVRPSPTETLNVLELRDPQSALRPTTIHFGQHDNRARLTVDPPTGNHGPHIILELPRRAELSVHLTAGELVFSAPPCTHTSISLHAGELVANLGPVSQYATIRASVTVGDITAEQLGRSKDGFFNSVHAVGAGQNTFTAHVGAGEITIKNAAATPAH